MNTAQPVDLRGRDLHEENRWEFLVVSDPIDQI